MLRRETRQECRIAWESSHRNLHILLIDLHILLHNLLILLSNLHIYLTIQADGLFAQHYSAMFEIMGSLSERNLL